MTEIIFCDKSDRGQNQIEITKISTPDNRTVKRDRNIKDKLNMKNKHSVAIDSIIENQKIDFRVVQNYIHGKNSPKINAFLSAAD